LGRKKVDAYPWRFAAVEWRAPAAATGAAESEVIDSSAGMEMEL